MKIQDRAESLYGMTRIIEGLGRLAESAVESGSVLTQARRRRQVSITLAKLEMEIKLAEFSLHVMSGKAEILKDFYAARNSAYRQESSERAEWNKELGG